MSGNPSSQSSHLLERLWDWFPWRSQTVECQDREQRDSGLERVNDEEWVVVKDSNGGSQICTIEAILSGGTVFPEDTDCDEEAQLDDVVREGTPSEGTGHGAEPAITTNNHETDPGDETGTESTSPGDVPLPYMTPQRVSDSATDSTAMTTNEIDPGGATGTERPRDNLKEHVPPCHETDLLQAEPYMTPQQVSESASYPPIATNGGATGTESSRDDRKEHAPPCHEIDSMQAMPWTTIPLKVSVPASDPAIAINGIDETGQGEGDEENISPSQEPMSAAGSYLISNQPQTTDPEKAKAVAAKDTLQAHSYTLSKCINPSALASGLFSRKIITSEDYERASNPVYGTERERALNILVKVIPQLERKPSWFDTVCNILKKEGVSTKKLKCDYQHKYDELTQDSAGQTERDSCGATASSGAKPSEVLTSDSETGSSEADSNSPTVEMQGPSFLQQACGNGSSMRNLTDSGVKETIPTENDGIQLHHALDHGYCNLFDVLRCHLTDTMDVNAQDKKGRTPLRVACLAIDPGNPVQREAVIPYLLESGARTDIVDEDEQIPLHLACQKSDACTAEMLLKHSIECLRARNKDKDTPLHIACRNGALDVVNVLLKYKADPHALNKDGNTPLHLACLNVEAAKRLVSYDHSTVDGIDKNQNTALHLACKETITDATLVDILMNKRIDKYNSEGCTTLHLASSCGNLVVVKQLLRHCRSHPFVNCQNKNGDTALHLASQNGFQRVVSLLLKSKYKAKRHIPNHANKTPLDVAREHHHTAVVQCLDPPHFSLFQFRRQKSKKWN